MFSRILALNRLYVGYSELAVSGNLEPEQYEKMEILIEDNHLARNQNEQRKGFWLAHPHLSNALYRSWFGERDISYQIKHLRFGIEDSFLYESDIRCKTMPLWSLSRSLVEGTEQHKRLFPDTKKKKMKSEFVKLLESVYQAWLKQNSNHLPLSLLPIWIQLYARCPELKLKPDPVKLAVEKVDSKYLDETGLRLTCHKLLQHFESWSEVEQETVKKTIISLLEAVPDWKEWPHVAADLINRIHDEQIQKLSEQWVIDHPSHPNSAILLSSMLRHEPCNERLLATTRSLLRQAPGTESWGKVAKILLQIQDKEIFNSVLAWVKRHRKNLTVGSTLGQLLKLSNSQEVRFWAFSWLKTWHLNPLANVVLEPLCEEPNPDKAVIKWSYSWLEQSYLCSGYLMETLIKACPDDYKIFELGQFWLEQTSFSDGSWAFVYSEVLKFSSKNQAILKLGFTWLEQISPKHGSWTFVLEALLEAIPESEEILGLGQKWLRENPFSHDSWTFVWEVLLRANPGDQELLELGQKWLQKAPPDHKSWTFVWNGLLQANPGY